MYLSSFLLSYVFLFIAFVVLVVLAEQDKVNTIDSYNYNNKGTTTTTTLRKKGDVNDNLLLTNLPTASPTTITFSVDLSTSDYKIDGYATIQNQQSLSFDLNSKFFSDAEYFYSNDDDDFSTDEQN